MGKKLPQARPAGENLSFRVTNLVQFSIKQGHKKFCSAFLCITYCLFVIKSLIGGGGCPRGGARGGDRFLTGGRASRQAFPGGSQGTRNNEE